VNNKTHKDDGGPAFPATYEHEDCTAEYHGMTLRDYLASSALNGLAGLCHDLDSSELPSDASQAEVVAVNAYAIADAMLAERKRAGS